MRKLVLLCAVLLGALTAAYGQRTDLSGLKFCIDPGHGGYDDDDRHVIPNPGIDFWESESNFEKALLVKSLLEGQGAVVILTRYNNLDPEPSLAARVEVANSNNVDWFHSIHSNASGVDPNTTINYTLMLVREKRPGGPASSSGNGLGIPEQQDSWNISASLISPGIRSALRTQSSSTYLDWTFYGGVNDGFSLGVLRGLLMPGELSEGSFHDFYPETRRLMNNDYHKMEAYALRNAFMQYFGVPADTFGIVAGIQKDIATSAPIDFASVRLMPENRVYHGDGYHNGFYMFDRLQPGPHQVVFESPGYARDSASITVVQSSKVFVDRSLALQGFPAVILSTPSDGDTAFPASLPVRLSFSMPMDTASVRAAFSSAPPIQGTITWSGGNSVMLFTPAAILPFFAIFTVTIDASAHSAAGQPLDGNGDGVSGDPFLLHFRTKFIDAVPPALSARYPDTSAVLASPDQVLCFTFTEPLNPASVTTTNFGISKIGGSLLARTLEYHRYGDRSSVNMYLTNTSEAGASYRVRISGVKDTAGNAIPSASPLLWQFAIVPGSFATSTIDAFDGVPVSWTPPMLSPVTTGVDSAVIAFAPSSGLPTIAGNAGCLKLVYTWTTGGSGWLLDAAIDSAVRIAETHWPKDQRILQVSVFGDGSNTLFRFVVDDSVDAYPLGTPTNREVSLWHTIDWIGWRRVEWDLANELPGTWVGNGILEGELRPHGFQLQYVPGVSVQRGELLFDQLQVVARTPAGVNDRTGGIPEHFTLRQNYPNPFNPSTQIEFSLATPGNASLVVYDLLGRVVTHLADGVRPAGTYQVTWNGRNDRGVPVASGVYFARMVVGGRGGQQLFSGTTKLLLER